MEVDAFGDAAVPTENDSADAEQVEQEQEVSRASGEEDGGEEGGDAPEPREDGRDPKGRFAAKQKAEAEEKKAATAAAAKRRIKYKVDGKEVEEEVTDEELIASRRQARTFHQRMEEAAKKEKVAQEHVRLAQGALQKFMQDPNAALKQLGMKDPQQRKAFLERAFGDVLEESTMTPEQRELQEYRAREAQARETAKQREEREAQEREEQEASQFEDNLKERFAEALFKSKLPRSPVVVRNMAAAYRALRLEGLAAEDITPGELAQKTSELMDADFVEHTKEMTDDELLTRYAPIAERIQRALLNRYRARRAPAAPPPTARVASAPKPAQAARPQLRSGSEIDRILGI